MTTDIPDVGALVRRLEKLEQQSRRLKWAVVMALLLLAVIWLMSRVPPKGRTIEAERFAIRDNQGKLRAQLTGDSIIYYAQDGMEQMTLDADHLAFFDPAQRMGTSASISLQVLHGEPTVWLRSRQGKIIWSAP